MRVSVDKFLMLVPVRVWFAGRVIRVVDMLMMFGTKPSEATSAVIRRGRNRTSEPSMSPVDVERNRWATRNRLHPFLPAS